jgi:hypothetical protein
MPEYKHRITGFLPPETAKRFRAYCDKEDLKPAAAVRQIVKKFFEDPAAKK